MLGPEYKGKRKAHLCIVTRFNGKPRTPTAHASAHHAFRDLGIEAQQSRSNTWPKNGLVSVRRALKPSQSATFQTPDRALIEMRLMFQLLAAAAC